MQTSDRVSRHRVLAAFGLLWLVASPAAALALTYLKPVPVPGDEFGRSIAILGSDVLISANYDDAQAPENGVAYLFDGATGTLLQTFFDPFPIGPVVAGFNSFSWSVATLGGDVLIGTPGVDLSFPVQNIGRVYRFDAATATLVHTYHNPTPAMADEFGAAVATVGPNVLIGAPGDSTFGLNAGAAYLFDGTTGALLQNFFDPAPGVVDRFGYTVAGVGTNGVLVGAPYDDANGFDSGAAHLFDATTGALLHTFVNPSPAPQDYFGYAMAALGNDILVSAPGDGTAAAYGGAVYRYDGTTFALVQTYLDAVPTPGEYLGWSVTAVGSNVAAGAWNDTTNGPMTGAAHVFDGATGAPVATCVAPVPYVMQEMGWSVAALGSNLVVGARSDSIGAPWAGAVHTCTLNPCGNGILDPGEQCDDGNTVNGDGCSATCTFEPNFLDHYMCYRTKLTSPFAQIPLTLADQFESSPATVKRPLALCPPLDKNGEGINDPTTHMEAYQIKQTVVQHVPRIVSTLDQFGSLILKTRKAQLLTVPTNKGLGTVPPPPPAGIADHYKCYPVKIVPPSPPFTPVTVTGVDQFENRVYTLDRLRFLCNPVDKNGEGIKTPSGHLLCYRVKTAVDHTKVIGLINTANQFGVETMDTRREEMLCVPALKEELP